MSVEDDVTIVSSWGQKAYHCFAKELEELQLLQQQQLQLTAQSQHELEERCKAEVDAQLLRELPDVFPHLASAFSASRSANGSQLSTPLPPSPPGRPSTKRPKSKHTHQRMQSEMAVVNAKRESLLQQHIQASMETQQRQPAHLLAAQYTEQLSRTQRQVELYLERETCELRRFTSKPLGAYALGEVLELPPTTTAPAAPAPAAAAPRTLSASHLAPSPALKYRTASFLRPEGTAPVAHRGTSERSVAALSNEPALRQKTKRTDRSGRTNGAAAACVHIAGKTGPPVLEKTGCSHQATDDTALLAIPPPFLIDAHQFAVEYNEMLKKEYGYCPAMTNTFATDEHAGSCEAAVMAAALKDQLRTHAPGVTNKRPTAAESSSWVLPLLETAARCVDTGAALSLLPAHASGEDGSDGKEPSSRLAHSFAKKKGLPTQPDTKKRATAGGSTSSPRQGGRVLPALSSVRGNILVSPTSNPLDGVECSSKGGGLSLSTYVGVPSRQVVRFVNRNAYRTRLRLKPASHPWLTYRCVCIAPSAAAAMVPPETPLNCGGYVEVEVVFCPTSFEASTATVEAVLEVGVTRELNDRVGKGAQWHFISVPLQGQVVLPHFEWWCSATADVTRSIVDTDEVALDGEPRALAEEEANDSVKAMDARGSAAAQAPWFITHDVLASRAARLDVSGPSSVVATFGDVLLLASVKQTLYLENTGSTAVVHVLSSSPEFTVSLPPVVPAALPTSHAMPLHVSFCPLSEGPCEGSLTVTVRASDAADSPVLTEHTVKLLGVGVVPRVRIASLGPQVVQEDAVPQWQLCKSEAPLNILLKGTIPSVPTEVPVTVRNDCAVPLPYHWHNGESPCTDESCGGDAESEQRGTHEEDQACIHERPATTTVTTFKAVTAVGVGANKTSYITPAFGILPPMSTTTFILTVTPHTLQPLQTLYNLFLDKMPDPSAPRNAAKLPFVDEGVLELYRRSRPIPCSAHGSAAYSVMPLDDPAVRAMAPPNGLQVTYLDPIAVFARFQTTQGEHSGYVDPDAVFATSFVTYQQPVLPTLSIDPAVLEERVECLIQSRTTRTVSLHNSSPIAMHFVLDPTAAEFAASVQQYGYQTEHTNPILTHERWRASFPASDGISVQCQPRKGQIPPYGTVTITVHFTLEAIGPHYAVVPCWIPEVELLCARLTATSCASRGALSKCKSTSLPINPRALTSAGAAGRRILLTSPLQEASLGVGARSGTANVASGGAGRRSKSASPFGTGGGLLSVTVTAAEDAQQQQHAEDCGYYALHVTATGVGPTVMTSTELLDFGLIELGQEAAASFTVSNPNSIPVLFDLCDPLMRQPPRFVFIPESFRLGAGNTVEVTVYRKVVSTEDAQTFFELTVRDGGASVAIETRATIQQPLLVIEDPVVQFGVVPESVWQCGAFHVSNRSALDTVFAVIPATPAPSYMELDYKAEHVLRAGEQLTVPVRCRFRICSTAITNHGNRGDTSASLVSLQKHTATAAGANDCYSTLLGVVSKRSRQTLLVEVRCDIVEPLAVSVDVVPEASPDGSGAVASTVHMSTEAYVRALLWNSLESILCARATAALDDSLVCGGHAAPLVAHHYCAALSLVDYMLDDVPLSCLSLTVILKNYTGCEANYDVCAKHFTPLPLEALGAPRIQDKRRKVEEGASRGGGSSRQASRAGASGGSRKTTQAQLQQRQEQPLSPFLALASRASTGSISNGGNDGAALPAFWIKSVQSDVTVQQQQWQMMEAAQKVLGDGRSCVTLLDSLAGSLGPYGQVQLPVRLLCTLPGRYAERLCVRANATLPWLQIPVDYEVYGKPIVLDTTTSGLITEGGRDGKEVLLMPPVIAPLGASRRTVRLVNRVSRDMDVTVSVFPCSLGMAVHAVDPDAPADQVELRLCAMTAEDQEKERNRVGRVTATPFQLRIPAHSRRDVLLEFTPTAKLTEESNADKYDTAPGGSSDCTGSAGGKGDGSTSTTGSSTVHAAHGSESEEDGEEAMLPPSDHWWEGSVCIHAMLAQSELNDVFLIDDFYARYADRYPSQRVARPISGAASAAGSKAAVCSSGSTSLSVAQLTVTQPLRIRPGGRVVRGGRVVWPCEAAQRVLDRAAAAGDALVPSITAAKPMDHSADSDDDNASSGGVFLNSQRPDSTLPLEVLQREAEERQALVAFMESRRRVLQEESHKYFTPIELRLRARCGRPHLTIEPSERCVSFPAVQHVNERTAAATSVVPLCTKTIRLTNRNSSALRFALSLSAANHSDGASLFSIVRCARWRSSQDAATELFTAGRTTSTAGAAAHEYTLDSMDALDVHVEVHTESSAWRQACAAVRAAPPLPSVSKKAPAVEGLLRVQFLPTSESADAACTSPDNIVSAPCQLLPLRVLLTTPLLECSPGVVWFRPGQQRHDGRRQVAYPQKFVLLNRSAVPVSFQIHPVTDADGEAVRTFRLQQQQGMRYAYTGVFSPAASQGLLLTNATMTQLGISATQRQCDSITRKVKASVEMPALAPPAEGLPNLVYVDEPARFSLSPLEGVVPAASLGGEPGRLEVRVTFVEFSDLRYESLFKVIVVGTAAQPPTYVLLRGDSRDTEV